MSLERLRVSVWSPVLLRNAQMPAGSRYCVSRTCSPRVGLFRTPATGSDEDLIKLVRGRQGKDKVAGVLWGREQDCFAMKSNFLGFLCFILHNANSLFSLIEIVLASQEEKNFKQSRKI